MPDHVWVDDTTKAPSHKGLEGLPIPHETTTADLAAWFDFTDVGCHTVNGQAIEAVADALDDTHELSHASSSYWPTRYNQDPYFGGSTMLHVDNSSLALSGSGRNCTVFVVYNLSTIGGTQKLASWSDNGGDTTPYLDFQINGSGNIEVTRQTNAGASATVTSAQTVTPGSWQVAAFRVDGAAVGLKHHSAAIEKSASGFSTVSGSTDGPRFSVGGRSAVAGGTSLIGGFTGNIAAVLCYQDALTDHEMDAVSNALRTAYILDASTYEVITPAEITPNRWLRLGQTFTTAIQNTIDAALGIGAGILIPAGDWVLTDTLTIPNRMGFVLRGVGAGQYRDPGASTRGPQTVLKWNGSTGKPIVLSNSNGGAIRDLVILDGNDQADSCFQMTNGGGNGTGKMVIDNVTLHGSETGNADLIGMVLGDPSATQTGNADMTHFGAVHFKGVDVCVRMEGIQQVGYSFAHLGTHGYTIDPSYIFQVAGGGSVCVQHLHITSDGSSIFDFDNFASNFDYKILSGRIDAPVTNQRYVSQDTVVNSVMNNRITISIDDGSVAHSNPIIDIRGNSFIRLRDMYSLNFRSNAIRIRASGSVKGSFIMNGCVLPNAMSGNALTTLLHGDTDCYYRISQCSLKDGSDPATNHAAVESPAGW